MLSRIFWVGLAGTALLIGMVLQDGRGIFSWVDDHSDISTRTERVIDSSIDKAVDRSVSRIEVTGPDGREIDADPAMKQALASAVGELVKAETDLALLKMRDEPKQAIDAANARRNHARGEVDRLKAELKAQDRAVEAQRAANQQQIENDIRDEIRETIRDAVRG